jgi:hypothetical protein
MGRRSRCSIAPVDDTRRRRARRRLLYLAVGASSVCLFFIAYGTFLAWDSYHRLPHVYAALRARGVPATANLVRCAPGIGIYRGVRCRLLLRFDGHLRTWDYPEDSAQFKGLAVGARRFPSWSTRVIRASSTPSVTSNTEQTLGRLRCSGTGPSWSCSDWQGSPSSSGYGDRQCPGPAGPASSARPLEVRVAV